jgi:3'(2'), 5'-bisphosphate nucleotidase
VEKIWDHAAGAAVIEGAGGRLTDIQGKDIDFTGMYENE